MCKRVFELNIRKPELWRLCQQMHNSNSWYILKHIVCTFYIGFNYVIAKIVNSFSFKRLDKIKKILNINVYISAIRG